MKMTKYKVATHYINLRQKSIYALSVYLSVQHYVHDVYERHNVLVWVVVLHIKLSLSCKVIDN
jgi:hypothetical protein